MSTINSKSLGILLACAASGALADGKPLSVTEEVYLAAAPSKTWEAIKDFDRWQDWHPAFASTAITRGKGNTSGTVRVLTTKDGARFTEELVSYSTTSRSYQYRIIESPLPITDYVSTVQIKQNKAGSTVVWSSNFKVRDGVSEEEMKETISGVYRAGLNNLVSVLK
ncbi:MAG TPA: SRPBCC family protein [Burkholderiales bacterium]|nr:SRPBCC family protein [Burkholderiales bacterium]